MYICLECGKEYKTENLMRKHLLACWRENHTLLPSKTIPSIISETRENSQSMLDFLNSFN